MENQGKVDFFLNKVKSNETKSEFCMLIQENVNVNNIKLY